MRFSNRCWFSAALEHEALAEGVGLNQLVVTKLPIGLGV